MSTESKLDNRALIDEEAAEAAATALTALSISPKADRGDAEESFEIPQRFTKSGRKRAVPFPLKVRVIKGFAKEHAPNGTHSSPRTSRLLPANSNTHFCSPSVFAFS